MKQLILITSMIGLAMLGVACSLASVSNGGPEQPHGSHGEQGHQTAHMGGHASYDPPSLDSLMERAELVVKGVPAGRTSVNREPASSPNYPARLVAFDSGRVIPYNDVDFTVETYYKGSGPATIKVVTDLVSKGGLDASTADLQDGQEYVLFLFRGNEDYWGGAYILTRQRGAIWTVDGDTAANEWEDFGQSLDLTSLSGSTPTIADSAR